MTAKRRTKRVLHLPPNSEVLPPPVEVVIRLREPLRGVPVKWLESAAGRKRAKPVFRSNEAKLQSLLLAGVPVRIERVTHGQRVRVRREGEPKKKLYLSPGS